MPETNAKAKPGGFSADERAAMKARAAELRAEGRKGAKKADGLQAALDAIAAMDPDDRAIAERVHVTMTTVARHSRHAHSPWSSSSSASAQRPPPTDTSTRSTQREPPANA